MQLPGRLQRKRAIRHLGKRLLALPLFQLLQALIANPACGVPPKQRSVKAIAYGSGGAPQIMRRSKDLKGFVQ